MAKDERSKSEQRMETVEQHIHVQLNGGAPWGFTLKGGLEHGEPLIITKIEEGGKAARCRKLRVGDELVNISGSALYGSRQEALVLIKGSYRTLNMVVRRQSIPVISPPSWHLTKLSEFTADTPPAMQLHPVPFSAPWHSGSDSSDVSMQWNQPCSTDHGSSLGSMESLDPSGPGCDRSETICSSKRDSAYSSFSASSNASDCTVSLRYGDAVSMDSLHGLGRCPERRPQLPASTPNEQTGSPSQPLEAMVQASSICCDTSAPPQPPAHRDSFQATGGCPGTPDECCVRDPSRCQAGLPPAGQDVMLSRSRCDSGRDGTCEGSLGQHFDCPKVRSSSPTTCLSVPEAGCSSASPSPLGTPSKDARPPPEGRWLAGGHGHSAPEKLLSAQLQELQVSGKLLGHTPPSSRAPKDEVEVPVSALLSIRKLEGSRCSTPGSATGSEPEPPREAASQVWSRSLSAPGNEAGDRHPAGPSPDLSGAASMDTLLEEVQAEDGEATEPQLQPGTSRQRRSATLRRRNERFATNLRNEIQRKKSQLQKCPGAGTAVHGDRTVEEEEDSDEYQEPPEFGSDPQLPPCDPVLPGKLSNPQPQVPSSPARNKCPPPVPRRPERVEHGYGLGEAGKVRRWRWTPEDKLQLEMEPERRAGVGAMQRESRPPKWCSSSRSDDCDILPFAERMKFFEETSRSQSVSNLSELTSRSQRHLSPPGHRRYSYQGYVPRPLEARRQSANSCSSETEDFHPLVVTRNEWRPQNNVQSQAKIHVQSHAHTQHQNHPCTANPAHSHSRQCVRCQSYTKNHVENYTQSHGHSRIENHTQNYAHSHTQNYAHSHTQNYAHSHTQNYAHSHALNHSQSYEHLPAEFYESRPPRSAFRPVAAVGCRDQQPAQLGPDQHSCTPMEAHPARVLEYAALNRKFTLTEWEHSCYSQDLQPVEGAVQSYENHCHDSGTIDHLFCRSKQSSLEQHDQRGRAHSESDIPLNAQGLPTRPAAYAGSALNVLQEIDMAPRKKGPPPPRPPPPNWEAFHRRRASQQSLLSSPSPPPSRDPPGHPLSSPSSQDSPLCSPCDLEMARHRSYSLPLEAETEGCRRCCQGRFANPPSPTFTRRAFRPVAPPLRQHNPPKLTNRPQLSAEPYVRSCDFGSAVLPGEDRPNLFKPIAVTQRCSAEWDTGTCQGSQCGPQGLMSKNTVDQGAQTQVCLPVNSTIWQQGELHMLPPYTRETVARQTYEERQPFETDIDEFQDEHGDDGADIEVEVQGFAQPATVLETDMDTLPEADLRVPAPPRPRGSLVVALLATDPEDRDRAELLGELLPPAGGTELSGESRRGSRWALDVNVDSLERCSRQGLAGTRVPSSGHPSCCCSSAAKAQMFCHTDELPGTGAKQEEEEEDKDISYKVARQLMESLRRKLAVLREAQRDLQEEVRANARLGEDVEALVLAVCRPGEVDKFRMLVGDLDKVVSLVLSLSGRLLRVESALDGLGPDMCHHERRPLLEKKQQLLQQLSEARELKEHVDRREQAVCQVLGRCLTPEQLRDYGHFVKMKAALLVEQRQLEDKIRLGEEQLRGLRDSLGLGLGVHVGLDPSFY